ncbi:MAG: type II secretion system F family protein [Planctomycetaceae bacterium]
MIFSKQIPLHHLALFCRSLRTMLHAGVPFIKTFELAAESAAHSRVKQLSKNVVKGLREGKDLATIVAEWSSILPELFVKMISVGEQTGQLPEVLEALADHYDSTVRLRREFRSEIILPILQFLAAIVVVGGVIWATGFIAEMRTSEPEEGDVSSDILGWGLQGESGVIKWFAGWGIALTAVILVYKGLTYVLPALIIFHRFLLHLPVIGPCLRAFAIARFSWAYHLTQSAGVPLAEGIEASLSATGNPYFASKGPALIADISAGQTISESFRRTDLFDKSYLQMVTVGEVAGTVPEVLHRLGPQFEDQAYRSLKFLSSAAATAVWGTVATFIIILIFRIGAWYLDMINAGLQAI